ncbi:hypothetical protein SAMN05192569_100227 [Parageobacillus thermantarcticus]|uniref:Uncharacterized protein n=1 Tax=Parageobacillus thermantarcticus TaxID=186116 RepID=A0A1I0SKZ7_9BACL|nr:hypothetical protein SAMN05192569_100227 [Parageobacillus thermantarcticus]
MHRKGVPSLSGHPYLLPLYVSNDEKHYTRLSQPQFYGC